MKKTFIFILAGLSILACSKQSPVSVPEEVAEPGKYIFKLTASMSNEDETKTSYAGEKTFSWDANDEISVLFHNGETHKFYTLKTTAGGTAATFSGQIDEGYEIGASASQGGTKWALYPAGEHTWSPWVDDKSVTHYNPTFNIPEVTDFTQPGVHFSANIPMYAKGDGDNNFTFYHQACGYKFTFTDIDVEKVRLTITHQTTHALSGDFNMLDDGKWYAKWASMSSPNRSVSYIKNVVSKTAQFYFSIGKDSESAFQPTITLTDEETGKKLYSGVAKTVWGADANLKPLYERMVILPSIPAPGTGAGPATIDVDWSTVTQVFSGVNDRIVEWKATSDADNLYFQYKFTKGKFKKNGSSSFYIGFDTDNDSSTGYTNNDKGGLTGGLESVAYFYPWTGGSADGAPDGIIAGEDPVSYVETPVGTPVGGKKIIVGGTIEGSYAYIEVAVPRSSVGIAVGSSAKVMNAAQYYVTTAEIVNF